MFTLSCRKLYTLYAPVNFTVVNVRARGSIYRNSLHIIAILNSNGDNATLKISVSHVLNDSIIIAIISSVDGSPAVSANEGSGGNLAVFFPEHGIRINGAVEFFVRIKVSIHRMHPRGH